MPDPVKPPMLLYPKGRTADHILRDMIGNQAMQIAELQAIVESLPAIQSELAAVKQALEDLHIEQAKALLTAPKE
jgi:hypothetical protein